MENLKGTTARLRHTFQYPDDSSSGTPDAMDEEEQETLIRTLADQNTVRNQQFRTLLLALPILSTIPYLLTLFHRSTFFLSVLGLTSLLSTAYLLYVLPPTHTGLPALDKWAVSGHSSTIPVSAPPTPPRGSSSSFSLLGGGAHRTPLETHLPLLNLGLSLVLVALGFVTHGPGGRFGRLGLGYLPAVVYGVVVLAKVVMAGVDPERELGGLRYEYKGA